MFTGVVVEKRAIKASGKVSLLSIRDNTLFFMITKYNDDYHR